MPTYALNHIHHEATDVQAAADWYVKLFDAAADEPFERGGATSGTGRNSGGRNHGVFEQIGQGREKARAFLKENPEITADIRREILAVDGLGDALADHTDHAMWMGEILDVKTEFLKEFAKNNQSG